MIPARNHYFPSFDGLRAIAILLVFFYHLHSEILPVGWMGVDLFFVLSGFLITRILLQTTGDQHFFFHFYLRRALRIFPLYYLTLFVFIALPFLSSYVFERPNPTEALWDIRYWYVFYIQNIYHAIHGWIHPGYLNHLWSLAIEEQFYLVWPLLVFLTRKRIHVLLGVAVVLILFSIGLRFYLDALHASPIASLTLTLTRLDSLLIGSVLAIFYFRGMDVNGLYRPIGYLAALFMVLFSFCYTLDMLSPLWPTFLALCFAGSIFYFVAMDTLKRESFITRMMRHTLLRYLGKWSYGFYVFHYPVILIFRMHLLAMISGWGFSYFAAQTITDIFLFSITLLLTVTSFYLFERQFLKLKNRFNYD